MTTTFYFAEGIRAKRRGDPKEFPHLTGLARLQSHVTRAEIEAWENGWEQG